MCEIIVYQENDRPVVAQHFRSPAVEIGQNWPKFAEEVAKQGIFPSGWGILEYFCGEDYNPDDVEYELLLPVIGKISPSEPLKAKTLEGGKVASAIHRGTYENIAETYDAIFEWIAKQGLQVAGNVREFHLRCPHTNDDPTALITEIQIPVR